MAAIVERRHDLRGTGNRRDDLLAMTMSAVRPAVVDATTLCGGPAWIREKSPGIT
jgi:hypothetical protein